VTTYIVSTDSEPNEWIVESTRKRIEEALNRFVTKVHVTAVPDIKRDTPKQVLVYVRDAVVVDVDNIEDAPAAALEIYRDSLNDELMRVRFDCLYLEGEEHNGRHHMWNHVIVAGKEVGITP